MSPSLRQNKRKNSFCESVFKTPDTPMTTDLPDVGEEEPSQNAPTPSNKAPRHENPPHPISHVESTSMRPSKSGSGPRTARVGGRSCRLPPVSMDSIMRSQMAEQDPLEQMYESTIMYDYLASPGSMPSNEITFNSPSTSLLGFGGLSLSSPAPGNALGLTNDSPAQSRLLPNLREALDMSRHPSDADVTTQPPFGTTSYDSRSTLASNTSFDNLVGLTPAQTYSPNMRNYHGSSSICFPPLPAAPSIWSPTAPGHHGETIDPFAEQFADADKETEECYAQGRHRTLADLTDLRRGSTSQVAGHSDLSYQGRIIPQSHTMPSIPPPDLPKVRNTNTFRGDDFVFPAPPTTMPGSSSSQLAPLSTSTRPLGGLPTPLLSPTRLDSSPAPSSAASSKTPFGRFWKMGLKSTREPSRRLLTPLPPVDELPSLITRYETSPRRSLRILDDEDYFDFEMYAADEPTSSTAATNGTDDSMTVIDEEDNDEEEITMEYLEKLAGPCEEVEYDSDADNVSEDDFPGRERSYTGYHSDPGYPIEGDWNPISRRYIEQQARIAIAGPNPAEFALAQLVGKVLHPEFARKYSVTEELGSGGYGLVCVAVDQAGKEVAVKFIHKVRPPGSSPHPLVGGEPLESYILRTVKHDNVIGFIEQFEDNSFYYLVQELHGNPWHRPRIGGPFEQEQSPTKWEQAQIKTATRVQIGMGYPSFGPSSSNVTPMLSPSSSGSPFTPFLRPGMQRRASYDLFECIEHRGFSEFQGRHVFQQLVDAVAHLHGQGIYHRDLKDENVVIDENLHVKLIDFGSAVCEDLRFPPQKYTEFKGTDAYAAPEIWPKNEGEYTAAPTDIWSLGLLLAMVLTRALPFKDGDVEYRFQLKCDVPDAAYDLIRSCLRINPEYRPTIQQVKVHYWLSEQYIRDLASGQN